VTKCTVCKVPVAKYCTHCSKCMDTLEVQDWRTYEGTLLRREIKELLETNDGRK